MEKPEMILKNKTRIKKEIGIYKTEENEPVTGNRQRDVT